MDNPGLPDELWNILDGKLWHATDKNRFSQILKSRKIQHGINSRYSESFSMSLDAISLFDFGDSAVDDWNQFNNWWGWFGHQQSCRIPVWLEISRECIANSLLDAGLAHVKWKASVDKLKFIPGVEACCCGTIPIVAIKSVLLIDRYCHDKFSRIDLPNCENILSEIELFEQSLPTRSV